MYRCGVCKKALLRPRQCAICNGFFCDSHIENFKLGKDEAESFQGDSTVYLCIKCLQFIRGIKGKPRHLWSEEEKGKTKGMAGKIVKMLGAAGVALVAAVFFSALWLFKKAAKLGGKEMGSEGGYEIEGYRFGEEEAEGFKSKFMEDNPMFEEESIFEEGETFTIDEQPLIEEEFQDNEDSEFFA